MENRLSLAVAPRRKIRLEPRARQLITALGGALAAFLLATLLHYIYDWSGGSIAAALLGAVNESVWEHMKILAVSYLLWSFAAFYILHVNPRRLLVARTLGVLAVMTATACFFYIYTGILGFSVVWVDIISAFVWLLLGEIVCLRVLNSPADVEQYFIIALAVLALVVVCLLCFTASPPRIGLFRDPVTGLYGFEARP